MYILENQAFLLFQAVESNDLNQFVETLRNIGCNLEEPLDQEDLAACRLPERFRHQLGINWFNSLRVDVREQQSEILKQVFDWDDINLLDFSVWTNRPEFIRYLVNIGHFDPNSSEESGRSLLSKSMVLDFGCSNKTIAALIEVGADVNIVNSDPMDWNALLQCGDFSEGTFEIKFDLAEIMYGTTVLHFAIQRQAEAMLLLLRPHEKSVIENLIEDNQEAQLALNLDLDLDLDLDLNEINSNSFSALLLEIKARCLESIQQNIKYQTINHIDLAKYMIENNFNGLYHFSLDELYPIYLLLYAGAVIPDELLAKAKDMPALYQTICDLNNTYDLNNPIERNYFFQFANQNTNIQLQVMPESIQKKWLFLNID
jgi:hypothetical protein